MTKNKSAKKGTMQFQHYLVVFLDILGQRNTLREIKELPIGDNEHELFIKRIQETIGKVDLVRDSFRNWFERFYAHTPNAELVPPELRKDFIATGKSDAYFYNFSDTTIIAVPLGSNDEHCTAVNGVLAALLATCGVGICLLAGEIVLRGGLDVGLGTELQEKEVYGPVLERAYYLESQLAEYPRFLVGSELVNYLLWVGDQEPKTILGQVAKEMASYCMELIMQDTDGRFMLDFLGEGFKVFSDGSINADHVIRGRDFAKAQYDKHVDDNNEKLAARYYRLLRYIKSRQHYWGVT